MKKYCLFLTHFLFIFLINSTLFDKNVYAQSTPIISNIDIGPTNLDISRFSDYYITAQIDNYPTSSPATISIETLNGDIGSTCWNFFTDGTCDSHVLTSDMAYDSGTTWKKTDIYPDYIYPEIFFAPSSVTWDNTPQNTIIQRNSYQLLHFHNPFTMTADMSFWIEFNAIAKASNSADLQVYLVSNSLDSFTSDWRNHSQVEMVGDKTASTPFHHTHTSTSSHHLVSLSTNSDGTIGSKHLDISGDFWIILYNTSPNNNRGWDLRYQTVCSHADNRWQKGSQSGWTVTNQTGCPDAHIHIARRSTDPEGIKDAVKFTITADSVSSSQTFYFNELPNLPPNATNFTNPVIGSGYSGTINITWAPASDPNDDELTYKINLLDSNQDLFQVLSIGTTNTSLSFNTTSYDDGDYSLSGQVCDPLDLCTDFTLGDLFTINNTVPLRSLSSITLTSDNADPTTALTGDQITLTYISSGSLADPQISFYSNGYPVTGSITTTSPTTSNWQSVFTVGVGDTNGPVTFTIDDSNLIVRYYDTTDSSSVTINNPLPSSTPTPTPTLTSIPTPTPPYTPSRSVSVSNAPSANPFICQDTTPVSAPNLFQINIADTTAKLFFTPVTDIDTYYISFSTSASAEKHGEQVTLLKEGVQSHTVYFLSPHTTYYFKIRGQNGCMPGAWSNIMSAKTNLKKFTKPNIFYQSGRLVKPSQIQQSSLPKSTTLLHAKQPLTPSPTQIPPVVTPTSAPTPISKRCFLWWCW